MITEPIKYIPKRQVKKKPVSTESGLQAACVKWFRLQYRQYETLLFAIPNGGHRNKLVAAKLKREGVLAGVPDLMLAKTSGPFNGLFIEMKVVYDDGSKKYTSPQQKAILADFKAQGYQTAVCYSLDEFKSAINNYLNL
ncbi:VRR-NUC domain-containing protein [Larkinella arboricola]